MERLIRRVRFSVSVSALLTLLIGLGLTALLFASVRRVESARQNVLFQDGAKLRAAAVVGNLHDAAEQLMVLNQLFNTFGIISREQFLHFTKPLLERYPEIQAFSFERLIQQPDRHAYETAMRPRHPGFTLTEIADGRRRPAAIRDSYLVVDYLEPLFGNEDVLGLDTAPMADQAEARNRSRSGAGAASTGLQSLLLDQGRHVGFRILAPVYWQGAPLDNLAARQRAVIGETVAAFRGDRVLDTILAAGGFAVEPGMTVSLYAGTAAAADDAMLVARQGAPQAAAGRDWLWFDVSLPLLRPFTLAGQSWLLKVEQAPQPFTAGHHGSFYALLGGLLSSLLAAAYVYSLVSRIDTIERVTRERTAGLEFANLRLAEDIAQRASTERRLLLRERVIEVAGNAIIICSVEAPAHAIEYVNPAFERITGFCSDEVLGKPLDILHGSSQYQGNIEEIHAALRERREGHALLRNYRKDGTGYWTDLFVAPVQDQSGAISHFVVAQYDISAAMGYEAELAFQASHDNLTGLANRNLLRERLNDAIAMARRNDSAVWVVFLDLDRFKFVNDTLGHEAGDLLLKILAGRLQAAVRETDTVARLGGDEFVLLLPENGDDGAGVAALQRIMAAVAEPLALHDHEFFLTCSIGVASYPADGDSVESLTKYADIAMYRAKELGRNTFQFYTAAMNERTLDRLKIEADLRRALERDEFVLHYQPQLSLESGRIVGMEALIRWRHPVHGMIAPARFIGLAEEMGLIVPIGAWVIRTACLQTLAWHRAGWPALRVAVNLSPRQFTQKALAQSIAELLRETGMAPNCLELELTESTVMSDVESAVEILRTLKALGIHISIDDFGTGYSSLSYLRRFPIDVLKIDQSFVRELTVDPDDAAIVRSIITLAHSLRLQVIAEGVESAEQLAFLRAERCDQMQGYYFSAPVDAAAFGRLLAEQRRLPAG